MDVIKQEDGVAPRQLRVDGKARCLSLLSGGLDSMLAICVLREQGAHVEAVVFSSPFFEPTSAQRAARDLDVPLHIVDFTEDILGLVEAPPHGFGGHMNPCIDCHAQMIKRAGALMSAWGFDCVCTGEVLGQRPMSQSKQSLGVVTRESGMNDFLVRPLCAKLLEPSRPEREGIVDRERLLGLSGRSRKPQLELAAKYGLRDYPTPAGGCLLTDEGFCRRLGDLKAHEGMHNARALRLLRMGRHMRLPGGAKCIIGRNRADNDALKQAATEADVVLHTVSVPGPTVLIPCGARDPSDIAHAARVCAAYGDHSQTASVSVRVVSGEMNNTLTLTAEARDLFSSWII